MLKLCTGCRVLRLIYAYTKNIFYLYIFLLIVGRRHGVVLPLFIFGDATPQTPSKYICSSYLLDDDFKCFVSVKVVCSNYETMFTTHMLSSYQLGHIHQQR